jgi:hypothetical protein
MAVSPAPLVQESVTSVDPSSVTVWSAVQVTGPLTSSPLVETVTALVYQPLAPSLPALTETAAMGAVWSMWSVSGTASVVSPAPLVQCPVISVAPWAVTVWSVLQDPS